MLFINNINQLTTAEIIKMYIDEFNVSTERQLMIKGEKYYKVENDILSRKMIRYENEVAVLDETKANNKLAHGFMHSLVEDKVNYLLVKPYTLKCDDETYLKAVEETLGDRFQKRFKQLGIEASNKGIGWLHIYIDQNGLFKTLKIPSEQDIPLWIDNDHEELQALIRYYVLETYEGKNKKLVTKIEYWTADNVEYFVKTDNGDVIVDSEMYLNDVDNYDGHFKVGDVAASWGIVPFIPFKNNDFELPDLQFVKNLVDNYDLTRSDVANLLEEVKNCVFVLKGYGGENKGEFVRDMAYSRAIKVEADEHAGVDVLTPEINIEAAEKHFQQLKKDIFDFGQGVDKNSDKLGNSPSGIALKFIYSGLDLKCNALEDSFKWGFEQLLFFVNTYLNITKKANVSDKAINIVFNRDIAINESQTITDCQNSTQVISNKTIIANHPWVNDVEAELKQIEEEGKSQEVDLFNKNDGNLQ